MVLPSPVEATHLVLVLWGMRRLDVAAHLPGLYAKRNPADPGQKCAKMPYILYPSNGSDTFKWNQCQCKGNYLKNADQ